MAPRITITLRDPSGALAGRFRHFGPILVRLCGPCRSGQHGIKLVDASAARAMRTGASFITLITNKNPNGEIRGQILAAQPEPALRPSVRRP